MKSTTALLRRPSLDVAGDILSDIAKSRAMCSIYSSQQFDSAYRRFKQGDQFAWAEIQKMLG